MYQVVFVDCGTEGCVLFCCQLNGFCCCWCCGELGVRSNFGIELEGAPTHFVVCVVVLAFAFIVDGLKFAIGEVIGGFVFEASMRSIRVVRAWIASTTT